MSQKRKQIRQAIKAQLLNTTSANDQVYTNRPTPVWDVELPAIFIYSLDEDSAEITDQSSSGTLAHYKVGIEGRITVGADNASSVDDALDDFASEIETQIKTDRTFGGLTSKAERVKAEIDSDYQGEQLVAAILLTYEVTYQDE